VIFYSLFLSKNYGSAPCFVKEEREREREREKERERERRNKRPG
jgi:hypothetical protein